ncbi:hypothetical protein BH23PLA1_BH23PLA1_11850 [soil metagenome]
MNELAGIANPFRETVVTDPWHPSKVDVPEIHVEAFAAYRSALETVRSGRRTTSVLLHGEAGSGKTHLLGRFRTFCVREEPHSLDTLSPEVVFVSVKLQTNPNRLWRYLRQSFVDDLLYQTGRDGMSQLKRIVLRRLAEVRGADGDLGDWWDFLRVKHPDPDELERVVGELLDRLDEKIHLTSGLCEVLVHFLMERHGRQVRSWLRGDALPDSTYLAMGLTRPKENADHEDEAREFVLALCRLAGPKIPVVVCFDQIEALQIDPGDKTPLFAFGLLIATLFNESSNLLLITCVQSSYLDKLNDAVPHYALTRMREFAETTLHPLLADEAVRLARSRLEAHPELASLRGSSSRSRTLWPLEESRLRQRIGPAGLSARRVLSACAEMFDEAKSWEIPKPIELPEFLADSFGHRREEAIRRNHCQSTDEILAHGLPMLMPMADGSWSVSPEPLPKDIDILIHGPDGRVGISLCNHPDLRKIRHRLKRLPALIREGRVEKLVILRDSRLPINKETKCYKFLNELLEHGAKYLRPSAEMLAALDALRRLLSDSRAGDLSNAGETVGPQSVQEWLAGHLPAVLGDFLEEVLAYPGVGEPGADPNDLDHLMELLEECSVLALEHAAAEMGLSVEALESFVRDHAREIGYLGGPPGVLFRLVPDELGVTSGATATAED